MLGVERLGDSWVLGLRPWVNVLGLSILSVVVVVVAVVVKRDEEEHANKVSGMQMKCQRKDADLQFRQYEE